MRKLLIALLFFVSTVSTAEIITDIPEITDSERNLLRSPIYGVEALIRIVSRSRVKNVGMAGVSLQDYPHSDCAAAFRTLLYGKHSHAVSAVNAINNSDICDIGTLVMEKANKLRQQTQAYHNLVRGSNSTSTQPESAKTEFEQPTVTEQSSQSSADVSTATAQELKKIGIVQLTYICLQLDTENPNRAHLVDIFNHQFKYVERLFTPDMYESLNKHIALVSSNGLATKESFIKDPCQRTYKEIEDLTR